MNIRHVHVVYYLTNMGEPGVSDEFIDAGKERNLLIAVDRKRISDGLTAGD